MPNPIPPAAIVGDAGELWLADHLETHGIPHTGFIGDPSKGIDGTILGIPVEVKTVTRKDADQFAVAAPYAHRYDDLEFTGTGLWIAVVHPEWRYPRFISWNKVKDVRRGPWHATKRPGFGRYDYYTIRMIHTRPCRRCVPR